MDSSKKKIILKSIIRVGVSAVLVLVLWFNIDFGFVMRELTSMAPWFLVCFLLYVTTGMLIEIVKWRALLPAASFGMLFKAFLYGSFFTLALPGQLFGEAAKMLVFGKDTGMYDKGVSTVVIDKITGLLAMMITGWVGWLFTDSGLPGIVIVILIVFVAASVVVLFSLRIERLRILFLHLTGLPMKLSPKFEKFCNQATGVIESWNEYLYKPTLIIKSLACGLLFNAAFMGFCAMIIWQYSLSVSVFDVCWIMATVGIVQALPISLAGIGVRDTALVAMFIWIGATAESAMILGMFLLLIIILRALSGAVCILLDLAKR